MRVANRVKKYFSKMKSDRSPLDLGKDIADDLGDQKRGGKEE